MPRPICKAQRSLQLICTVAAMGCSSSAVLGISGELEMDQPTSAGLTSVPAAVGQALRDATTDSKVSLHLVPGTPRAPD